MSEKSIRTWARCYHATRSIAFVRGAALDDEDDTNPVSIAAGTFVVAYA
ncbi:MAG: hypothetical protein GDA40_05975 [Rhodobacteraceae bacterium]|nr:hypothetical protein [Paracoccaceae bacterium]